MVPFEGQKMHWKSVVTKEGTSLLQITIIEIHFHFIFYNDTVFYALTLEYMAVFYEIIKDSIIYVQHM